MFDSWLEQEKETIRSRFGKLRILGVLIAIFMVSSIFLPLLSLCLDSGGVISLIPIIFSIFVIGFALSITNYKKRFIKPLLASVRQELATREAQEEFARQMQEAKSISYQPRPQIKACEIMVAKEYCYMRQPGKSRIIQNRQIRRAVLMKEEYMVGRGHVRYCYALALYAAGDEKPVWKGCFMDLEKAAQAFRIFQEVLPPEALAQDEVSNPQKAPQKPLWKNILWWILYLVFMAVLIYLVRLLQN